MIIDINSATLDKIQNSRFKSDAARYVKMYSEFMRSVSGSGIQVDTASASSGLTDMLRFRDLPGVKAGKSGNSLHYGEISPACTDCHSGAGSMTVFHTLKCNRDCYFCANMNQDNYDYYLNHTNDAFEELIRSEPRDGFRSIALTGGEPLMMPAEALDLFRRCRERYPHAYLRLYTNGDLLTLELAKALAQAGLNEIRISIKVDDGRYPQETISIIEMAVKQIPTVMVEMPVIPGTLEVMKDLLVKLENVGCKGINILEFLYPWLNNEKYESYGFKVKARPYKVLYSYSYAGGLPISGSSDECLELLAFAADKKLNMGVHYCSLENKLTSQIFDQNSRTRLMPYEMLSEKDFFIKTARAYAGDALRSKEYFDSNMISGYEYSGSESTAQIEFHPKYVKSIAGLKEAALCYNVVESENGAKIIREVKMDLIAPEDFDYENDL